MDPQLWEEIETGDADGEIDAIIRLDPNQNPPENLRLVARFGDIATCRLRRRDILDIRAHPAVRSLKASRGLASDDFGTAYAESGRGGRRPDIPETGRGVVVGIVDYGCDFAHAAFRNRDGTTRLKYLWLQGAEGGDHSPEPYRRGRLITEDEINDALRARNPYRALGYHPTRRGATRGSHGTHVMDIAAGSGRGNAAAGMAPGADLIFVHVAASRTSGTANFGDSVSVMEAVDFIRDRADDQPCVINVSLGKHGGPHDGSTLLEQSFDRLLQFERGFSIIQSAGNYYNKSIHAQGRLRRGESALLKLRTQPSNTRTKELEIWYPRGDRFRLVITPPGGRRNITLHYDSQRRIVLNGAVVGRAYHRVNDPGNGDTHVDVFLYRNAPSGIWRFQLVAENVRNGRWHAWIEREGSAQTRFVANDDPDQRTGRLSGGSTAGTIANGRGVIQVAAYDARSGRSERYASFSSAGPTRDGRMVPFVAAPGVGITAARSALNGRRATGRESMSMNGTSMAAPHVTGLVALMLEAAPRASQRQIRGVLARSARQLSATRNDQGVRSAHGAVREETAVRMMRRLRAPTPTNPRDATTLLEMALAPFAGPERIPEEEGQS